MCQNQMSLEQILASVKESKIPKFIPEVSSFKEFKTLASLCAELAKRIDEEPEHNELKPYCGVPLANAMVSLCAQLAEFKSKIGAKEESDELFQILTDYVAGALPFIRLNTAYCLNNQLTAFMEDYPDAANVEISKEGLDELPQTEYVDTDGAYYCEGYDGAPDGSDDEGCDEDFYADYGVDYVANHGGDCSYGEDYPFEEEHGEDYDADYGEVYWDDWRDADPLAYLAADEKGYDEFRSRRLEWEAEETARRFAGFGADVFRVNGKMTREQLRLATPFAREYFLAKAIDFCSMSSQKLYEARVIDFPERGFSAEARREVEKRSTEGFVRLYNKIASDESLKTGLQVANRALKEIEEKIVRCYAEGD